ncbi:MAG: hypothetical protein KBG54_01750 [Oscillospiraceae bacterium]|nr:hypothetical protein [Oscillospiraceae bacterium]
MEKTQIGTWCEIPTPYVTNILADAGLDFVILDMEHGVISFETAQNMVFAAHAKGCKVYLRVPAIKEEYALRALDIGSDGIVFPQVETREDVLKIVALSKFAPVGERGFNPYITAGGFQSVSSDFFETENNRGELVVILESTKAFDNLDEILACKEIDVVYIGQYDLSVSLNVPGQVQHPLVQEYLHRALIKISKSNKRAGCMVHSCAEARVISQQGFDFLVYKADTGIVFSAFHDFVKELNG